MSTPTKYVLLNGNHCYDTCTNEGNICKTCTFPVGWAYPKRYCEDLKKEGGDYFNIFCGT